MNSFAEGNQNSIKESFKISLNKDVVSAQPISSLQAYVDIDQEAVQVKWNSNQHSTASKFIIEKSIDKNTWIEVSTVFGAGHKKQSFEYFHMDYSPLENLSYYRITEISAEGEELHSNITPVNYLLVDHSTAGINLFPTLAISEEQTIVNIAFEEIFEKEILIVVRDRQGEEYYAKVIFNIEDERLVAVPVENEIPKGDYLITASSENQMYSQNIKVN
jgi:hypothetical protein